MPHECKRYSAIADQDAFPLKLNCNPPSRIDYGIDTSE